MIDHEQLLDELGMCFARAAVDRLLAEQQAGSADAKKARPGEGEPSVHRHYEELDGEHENGRTPATTAATTID